MASDRTVPFLFLNLGGEMMYILDQRLKAQQIPKDKATKDDLKVRVSVFLRQGVQNNDGKFVIPTSGPVPPGSEVPGPIRLFDGQGECRHVTYFQPKGKYMPAPVPGSIDLHGNRRTSLGNNIYATSPSTPNCTQNSPEEDLKKESGETAQNSFQSVSTVVVAQEELNLLMAQLLGNRPVSERASARDVISINLFGAEVEEVESGGERSFENVINIDARRKPRSEELERVYGEMTLRDDDDVRDTLADRNDENDILELLDSLNS